MNWKSNSLSVFVLCAVVLAFVAWSVGSQVRDLERRVDQIQASVKVLQRIAINAGSRDRVGWFNVSAEMVF